MYKCGSILGWSPVYSFHTTFDHPNWSPTVAIYGDMGVDNAITLPALKREAKQGKYDAILHLGDFAYDMCDENGKVGDQFMRQLEPLAARLPYMVSVGNHESK